MKAKILLFAVIAAFLTSCGPKDAKINTTVQGIVEQYASGITTSTQKGVVTLTGELQKEINYGELEAALKKVKGVKSIVNNLTVKVEEPVISPDNELTSKIGALITADRFKDVQATVLNGEVTLNGSIKKSDLMDLIQLISELQPKKINNNLTLK